MNHAELSRDLALAIGYAKNDVHLDLDGDCWVWREPDYGPHGWKLFDYRSPDVALPLLEWLMRHHSVGLDHYFSGWVIRVYGKSIQADTLEEVIARACIALKGKP